MRFARRMTKYIQKRFVDIENGYVLYRTAGVDHVH